MRGVSRLTAANRVGATTRAHVRVTAPMLVRPAEMVDRHNLSGRLRNADEKAENAEEARETFHDLLMCHPV